MDAAFEIVETLVKAIALCVPLLLDCAVRLIVALIEFLTNAENYALLIECSEAVVKAIADGIAAAAAAVWVGMEQVHDEIWDWFRSVDWKQLGIDILHGLANGLSDGLHFVTEKISGIKDSVVDDFKDAFGIHSPSKLMEEVVGRNLALGIGVGFTETLPDVSRAAVQAFVPMQKQTEAQITLPKAVEPEALEALRTQSIFMNTATAVPSATSEVVNNHYSYSTVNQNTTEARTEAPTISPTFYVQIGNEELRGFVVSVIDQENAVTGGNAF